MEGDLYPAGKIDCLENLEEDEEIRYLSSLPEVHQPETPAEPIEFLARSWSLSASEISKAISLKQTQSFTQKDSCANHETADIQQLPGKFLNSYGSSKTGAFGKWFHHHKDNVYSSSTVRKKDRARAENARLHSALSVAALATSLAAVAAAEKSNGSGSKMNVALASATELLASHCIEMAESAGADHSRVASVVRSAVDIKSPGDLMTLTAAAATALRGESAMRSRLSKEARKNASVSPYERPATETQVLDTLVSLPKEEQNTPCVGELLQVSTNGVLRWKHVCVNINKNSQVIIKIKSKHLGGSFSKKNKCIVYGICDENTEAPYRKEDEDSSEDVYFGLKTAQGQLEFKCRSMSHKNTWVDGIQILLHKVNISQTTEHSSENSKLS